MFGGWGVYCGGQGCPSTRVPWEPWVGRWRANCPPSLKGGGSLALVLVLWPRSARAFPVLPQLVLLPFAASRVSWAAGPALGPTQSDEAACQHLVEGGLGSPFLVPSPVSSRTYRICCTIFLLPCPYRIVSCLLEREHPQHCPAGRSALDVKVAIPLQYVQSRRGMRNHREAQRLRTSQVHRRHHQRHNQTTPFLPLQDTRGSWQVGRGV